MSTLGISNALANLWLNTLLNIPYTAPITCAQVHVGFPGSAGTSNPSATTARSQITFAASTAQVLTITGGAPQFAMVAAETITHISVWSGFDGDPDAVFLFSAAVNPPPVVANGDTLSLNACTVTVVGTSN